MADNIGNGGKQLAATTTSDYCFQFDLEMVDRKFEQLKLGSKELEKKKSDFINEMLDEMRAEKPTRKRLTTTEERILNKKIDWVDLIDRAKDDEDWKKNGRRREAEVKYMQSALDSYERTIKAKISKIVYVFHTDFEEPIMSKTIPLKTKPKPE